MKRVELKFLLTYDKYLFFKNRVQSLLAIDREKYPVFSQYFDTDNLDFLYDKIEGELYHMKIRVRKYGYDLQEKKPLFLESKIKEDKWGMKHRQVMNKIDPEKFSPFFKSIFTAHNLTPTCNIFYHREAFEKDLDGKKLRVNFDTDLLFLPPQATKIKEGSQHLFSNNGLKFHCILEVKYTDEELPDFFQKELQSLGVEQSSFSKYSHAALAVINKIRGEQLI